MMLERCYQRVESEDEELTVLQARVQQHLRVRDGDIFASTNNLVKLSCSLSTDVPYTYSHHQSLLLWMFFSSVH